MVSLSSVSFLSLAIPFSSLTKNAESCIEFVSPLLSIVAGNFAAISARRVVWSFWVRKTE